MALMRGAFDIALLGPKASQSFARKGRARALKLHSRLRLTPFVSKENGAIAGAIESLFPVPADPFLGRGALLETTLHQGFQ